MTETSHKKPNEAVFPSWSEPEPKLRFFFFVLSIELSLNILLGSFCIGQPSWMSSAINRARRAYIHFRIPGKLKNKRNIIMY